MKSSTFSTVVANGPRQAESFRSLRSSLSIAQKYNPEFGSTAGGIGQMTSQSPRRINSSFIASLEKKAISVVLPSIPRAVTPIHLTIFGLIGAAFTSISLIACTWYTWLVIFVPAGLLIHWLGDSFDGALARYRGVEQPAFGFFIDHSSDLIALTLIIVSFGLSPFFTLTSALLVATMFLLFSAYTYIKVAAEGIHQLAYGGLGGTEFRLLMAGWSIAASALGPQIVRTTLLAVPVIDLVTGVLSIAAFCGLICLSWQDQARIRSVEQQASREAPRCRSVNRHPRGM